MSHSRTRMAAIGGAGIGGLVTVIALVAIGVGPSHAADKRGDTATYEGEFTDGGTLSFGVLLKENGKPKEVNATDPNEIPVDCEMSGPATTSPTVDGEIAKVKRGKFKWKITNPDTRIVFKGEFKPGGKAKGTLLYRFTETPGDECSTGGPLVWKAKTLP